jgi:hypothetical protein
MEKKFLTEEELKGLKDLNTATQDLIIKLGQNEYQVQIFNDQKKELIKEFEILKTTEITFSQNLQSKYGVINVNIETGEITSIN